MAMLRPADFAGLCLHRYKKGQCNVLPFIPAAAHTHVDVMLGCVTLHYATLRYISFVRLSL